MRERKVEFMAKGKRVAAARLHPFYIGVIIFIVAVVLLAGGAVALAGGFPQNGGQDAESGAESLASNVADSSQPGTSSAQDASSGQTLSSLPPKTDFAEQFAKNPYDAAFEQKMNQAMNNTQVLNVYNEYINIWKEEIGRVMEKMTVLDSGRLQEVQAQQGEWVSTVEQDLQKKYDEIDAGGIGSMNNIRKAEAAYQIYRGRAVALYQILYEVVPDFTVGSS